MTDFGAVIAVDGVRPRFVRDGDEIGWDGLKRVYKAAFTHEIARSIITKDSGSHFDPDIVQAFIDNESGFLAIRDRLQEHDSMAA